MYNLAAGTRWQMPSSTLYKWLDNAATHDADSPWFTYGRFGAGGYKTLYLAESPTGALAEFLRRHPELFDFQSDLDITIYGIDVVTDCDLLDVRERALSDAIGFNYERLLSSDPDESIRYVECRELGAQAMAADLCGLAYPSAAATWATWNVVLFGDSNQPGRWQVLACAPVGTPALAAAAVNILT